MPRRLFPDSADPAASVRERGLRPAPAARPGGAGPRRAGTRGDSPRGAGGRPARRSLRRPPPLARRDARRRRDPRPGLAPVSRQVTCPRARGAREFGRPAGGARLRVLEAGERGAEIDDLARRLGVRPSAIEADLRRLTNQGKLLAVPPGPGRGRRFLAPATYQRLAERAAKVLAEHFKRDRLAVAIGKADPCGGRARRRGAGGRLSRLAGQAEDPPGLGRSGDAPRPRLAAHFGGVGPFDPGA